MFRRISSFTLVELLIVIGILAILTAVIVVILNPAELLKQARDSQRIQDLTAIEHTLQLLETQDPDVFVGISTSVVYISIPDPTSASCIGLSLPALPAGYTNYACVTDADELRKADGNGWIPINFNTTFSSLPTLPVDPINSVSQGLYYTMVMGGSFEVNALLESNKYRPQASSDGGDSFSVFERGNNKALTPFSDTGLVGYWTFDEGTGTTAADSSGNGNTGTLTNGPTWQSESDCKVGGCLLFDGVTEYGTVADADSLDLPNGSSISLSGWFKTNTISGRHMIMDKGGSCIHFNYGFGLSGTNLDMRHQSTDRVSANITVDTSTWHHFTAVYGDAADRFYYDGSLVETQLGSWGESPGIENLYFGAARNTCVPEFTDYFDGLIDDVRIYNRALSAAEIQAIYNASR